MIGYTRLARSRNGSPVSDSTELAVPRLIPDSARRSLRSGAVSLDQPANAASLSHGVDLSWDTVGARVKDHHVRPPRTA